MTQQQPATTRSIILRPWEARGILDGSVTQLWRAMKPQPTGPFLGLLERPLRSSKGAPVLRAWFQGDLSSQEITCPYGGSGSRLWGKESWCEPLDKVVLYRAGGDKQHIAKRLPLTSWRSSTQMPRHHSRIALEVERVSALPVREISALDALASGFGRLPCAACDESGAWGAGEICEDCDGEGWISEIANFRRQWNQDNPRHPYSSNPYAWRLVVRRVAT